MVLWKCPAPPPLKTYVHECSLHSYREGKGLIRSRLLCPSCGVEPHTAVHIFSYSLHPTPLAEMDLRGRPHLASEFLFGFPFFNLPPLLPPIDPTPSGGQQSLKQSSSSQVLLQQFEQIYMNYLNQYVIINCDNDGLITSRNQALKSSIPWFMMHKSLKLNVHRTNRNHFLQ